MQTPVIHAAESRGRDGVMHVAVAQPAHGHVARPPEPLVVVEVSTDPTARNITSIVEPRPVQAWPTPSAARPVKGANILLVCIFGACLIVAAGIGAMLLGRYRATAAAPANPPASSVSAPAMQPPAVVAAPIPTPPAVATTSAPVQASPSVSAAVDNSASAVGESAPTSTHHASPHSSARPHAAPVHSNSATHAEELERGID